MAEREEEREGERRSEGESEGERSSVRVRLNSIVLRWTTPGWGGELFTDINNNGVLKCY